MKPKLSYQQNAHPRQASLSRITTTPDVPGLLFFADVFIRKITKEKYKQPFFAKTATKQIGKQIEKIKARVLELH